jgi:tetratricopeptide (TPR) repeat protein
MSMAKAVRSERMSLNFVLLAIVAALIPLLWTRPAVAQVAMPAAGGGTSSSAQQAVELATTGRCKEALPELKRALPRITAKDLKYRAGMAMVRCAMALQEEETAVDSLLLLKREFPGDPEVLYIATHYFSQLGDRAARDLAAKAPSSFQAQKLQAEALESRGKNDEAAEIYRKIVEENPKTPGIHYRIGQVLLAEAGSGGSTDEARKEFQKEIGIDPLNAAPEFVLGELARREGKWEEAIQHFTRASTLDVGFAEAYLALGMSLNASGRFSSAVKPLESYVTMQPGDPAGHYQLAIAYARVGNKDGSNQQLLLQTKAASSGQSATDTTEGHAVSH